MEVVVSPAIGGPFAAFKVVTNSVATESITGFSGTNVTSSSKVAKLLSLETVDALSI